MRRWLNRTALAVTAGIAASTLIASPALAATFTPDSEKTVITVTDGGVRRGTVSAYSTDGGQRVITVCDWYSDGWVMTGRVDPGNGVVEAISTNGVGVDNCEHRFYSNVRKWRAAWAGEASGWLPHPDS